MTINKFKFIRVVDQRIVSELQISIEYLFDQLKGNIYSVEILLGIGDRLNWSVKYRLNLKLTNIFDQGSQDPSKTGFPCPKLEVKCKKFWSKFSPLKFQLVINR